MGYARVGTIGEASTRESGSSSEKFRTGMGMFWSGVLSDHFGKRLKSPCTRKETRVMGSFSGQNLNYNLRHQEKTQLLRL